MKNLTIAITGLLTALTSFSLTSFPVSAQAPPAAREGEVALIGCIEMERDYRARKESGRGGALGSGVGVGNEFVLTMAKPVATGRRGQGGAAANAAGRDYELTGKLEKELLRYVGRQVEVIGVIEKADDPMPAINITLWHPVGDYCPAK
jgi:hypothetical protein